MRIFYVLVSVAILAACGGGNSGGAASQSTPPAALVAFQLASSSDVTVGTISEGVTPFISLVEMNGTSLANMASMSYTIAPKPGTVSKPVAVSFTADALSRLDANLVLGPLPFAAAVLAFSGTRSVLPVVLPVFGLYAGYANSVSVQIVFTDASVQTIPLTLVTNAYTDPNKIYDHPVIIKKRAPGTILGFDFFAMKSNLGTPVIVDTDSEIRWVGGPGTASGFASIFTDNGFVIGDQYSMATYRLELDGSFTETVLTTPTYVSFSHNIDPGKVGYLATIVTLSEVESTVSEFTYPAGFGKQWDMAELLSAYMTSQGDDPTKFVRPSVDWFHSNASTYDPRDNSVIVSSRENFLIKVDYDTGNIIWILGDPTKYWYTFPSLRAKALTLASGGLYPIGQHAVSITSDGLVMVFNDGQGSVNQPSGAPAGETRTYSAVSAYAVDETTQTATEIWRFDYGQSIFSAFCGSAYEAPGKTLLVDYPLAADETLARLVGLDENHNVAFDFQYKNAGGCNTSWNAVPVHFEQMVFQ